MLHITVHFGVKTSSGLIRGHTMAKTFTSNKYAKIFSVFLFVIFVFIIMTYLSDPMRTYYKLSVVPASRMADDLDVVRFRQVSPLLTDQSFVDCMTDGGWVPDADVYSKSLETRLDAFFRKTRDLYNMPDPLQRTDNKCGSIPLGGGAIRLFRAVCDPFQSTPCCFHGTCKNISIQECSCPDCFDLRQTLHGELSKWVGRQSICPIEHFSSNEACEILRGRTLVFIGDSFMRQMFMGTQILLTNNDVNSCVWKSVPEDKRAHCQWMYMFTRECRFFIPKKDVLCNGTVTLLLHEYYKPGSLNLTQIVHQYKDLQRTTIIVGVGLHYSFDTERIIKQVALPILDELQNMGSGADQVFWMLPHCLGILKTPTLPGQLNPKLIIFNREMRKFLSYRGVTMVEAFNLTRKLASYDGSHYPKAPNVLKVQIFLNHIVHKGSTLTESVQNHPRT